MDDRYIDRQTEIDRWMMDEEQIDGQTDRLEPGWLGWVYLWGWSYFQCRGRASTGVEFNLNVNILIS